MPLRVYAASGFKQVSPKTKPEGGLKEASASPAALGAIVPEITGLEKPGGSGASFEEVRRVLEREGLLR